MDSNTAVNSLPNFPSGGGFDESSANLLQQLISNGLLGQASSFHGSWNDSVNGSTSISEKYPRQQQDQAINYAANTSLLFPSGTMSVPQHHMNNMMFQAVTSGQGPTNFSTAATSCALSRWIASHSSANNQLAVSMPLQISSSAPVPNRVALQAPQQQQHHQTDNEPFPLTSISFQSNSSTNFASSGNGNAVMNMQEMLLGGGEQLQLPIVENMNPIPNSFGGTHLVSDNDLDSSSTGLSVNASKSARFRRDQAEQWSERYDELILFLKEHGHCRVPRNHKKYGALSSWVKRQRYQYKLRSEGKSSFLTDERVAVLEQLGFIWDSHTSVWEQRFEELQKFQKQFGHSNVPYNYKNAKLASWIKAQRREMRAFKEGKTISPEMFQRFMKLEKLDFCWQLRSSGRKNHSKEALLQQVST
ncbi:helicase domain protein [Nitzschia inconspicua]|uniref:Helicase domain protein n=1 Tax=Nitzschia inconspicua TaxID=303405 RepID=A0A9K3PAE2_9STRA|nr:helicase domain protein [Nitzschia inconspicua]KAG7358694.1 helicase domain protein [Nitzschia inconspicua]